MSKFEIGDEVRILGDARKFNKYAQQYIGRVAKITGIIEGGFYGLKGIEYLWKNNELELVESVDNLPEMVNHPQHYNQGKYEAIDVIEDWKLNFNLGSAIKYIARCDYKDNKKEDLEKAKWYIDRELQKL